MAFGILETALDSCFQILDFRFLICDFRFVISLISDLRVFDFEFAMADFRTQRRAPEASAQSLEPSALILAFRAGSTPV
jgi:hypothetical protein